MFHMSVLMEEHSTDECTTHLLASVGVVGWGGALDISSQTPSLQRLLRSCRASLVSVQEPRSTEQLTSTSVYRVLFSRGKRGGHSGRGA